MRKVKKASKTVKKSVVILITTVLCLLLLGGYLIFFLISENRYYKIESRVNNVEKNKKKDTDDYETVGWIKVQGTDIDYPVIYAPSHNFDLDMGSFSWTEAKYKELNNIVYLSGHNILNLSTTPIITDNSHTRFEQLMSFTYLDFVEKNKYIQYTFNNKEYLYKIFAVSYPFTADIELTNNKKYSKKKMQKYIKESLDKSIFKFDVDVNENDKVISLVTCTRMFGSYNSFKVDARLVRTGELINNYKVTTSKKYKEIDEIMEGGSSNEKI